MTNTHTLFITENAYVLCASHLAEWHAGGSTVEARPLDDDETSVGAEYHGIGCADCPQVNA